MTIDNFPIDINIIIIDYLDIYSSLAYLRLTNTHYRNILDTLFYQLCKTNYLSGSEVNNLTIKQLLNSNWWKEPPASMSHMKVGLDLSVRLDGYNFSWLKNNRYYQGMILDGKREGDGDMKWENGYYSGTWNNDIRNGYGTMRVSRGPVYNINWDR